MCATMMRLQQPQWKVSGSFYSPCSKKLGPRALMVMQTALPKMQERAGLCLQCYE